MGAQITHVFTVRDPHGRTRQCSVHLPVYVVDLVKAHADRETMPGGNRFWQGLCEEMLANYVWQHADLPPDETIQIDEFTTVLQRWVDAVVAANISRQ